MVNIIEISNLNLPELAVYAELSEGQLLNRHEPEKGLFVAESPKVVLRALDAGYEPVSLLVENRLLTAEDETGEILQKCGDIPVYTAEFDVLTQITGFKLTRGMLCAMHRKPLLSPEEICRNTDERGSDLSLRRCASHGRGAADAVLQQSTVSPRNPCQHGKCIPHPMDFSG